VVIEFTRPEFAEGNINACLNVGVPVVSGTTGWAEGVAKSKILANDVGTSFLWASNFSVGVNIFFAINKMLAQLMNDLPEYDVKLEEIHHLQKLDSPSGTAITIAEQILDKLKRKNSWKEAEEVDADTIKIE